MLFVGPVLTRLQMVCAVAAIVIACALDVQAQNVDGDRYPTRPIRLIVGFSAGGTNDILARLIGQKISETLGQPVIIENQPGAGGRLSASYVMAQPPDGHTLLVGATGTMSVECAIDQNLPYHPTRNFVPLAMLAKFPLMLVTRADHPATTVAQLSDWAKKNPDKANYGTTSPVFTIATELLKAKTGMLGVAIYYKGTAEMMLSVLSGQSAYSMQPGAPTIAAVKEGKIRALAVTGTSRMVQLPEVPTVSEIGYPDVTVELWTGIFAPEKTPPSVVARLLGAIKAALEDKGVRDKIDNLALTPGGASGDGFRKLIDTEIKQYVDVIASANLKFRN